MASVGPDSMDFDVTCVRRQVSQASKRLRKVPETPKKSWSSILGALGGFVKGGASPKGPADAAVALDDTESFAICSSFVDLTESAPKTPVKPRRWGSELSERSTKPPSSPDLSPRHLQSLLSSPQEASLLQPSLPSVVPALPLHTLPAEPLEKMAAAERSVSPATASSSEEDLGTAAASVFSFGLTAADKASTTGVARPLATQGTQSVRPWATQGAYSVGVGTSSSVKPAFNPEGLVSPKAPPQPKPRGLSDLLAARSTLAFANKADLSFADKARLEFGAFHESPGHPQDIIMKHPAVGRPASSSARLSTLNNAAR